MIRWWEHSEKGGRDGRRDGQTDNTICRAAWSQLKTYRLKTFADLRRRWRSCVTRIGHTAAADAPVGSCIQLSHLYASVPPVYFCCSWISWSSRNFRQRSWLHCDSYWRSDDSVTISRGQYANTDFNTKERVNVLPKQCNFVKIWMKPYVSRTKSWTNKYLYSTTKLDVTQF